MELYSFDRYKGFRLFVEVEKLDDNVSRYEGAAQENGTTLFTANSLISGDAVVRSLKDQIDKCELY